MEEWNLTSGELFFLNVHHHFEFLRLKGYKGNRFELSGREDIYVTFYNNVNEKCITIIEKQEGFLDFIIHKKGLFNSPRSYYKDTGLKHSGVGYFSKIIQSNQKIMDLI